MACSLRSQKCNLPSSTYTLGSQHCLEKWNSTHTTESFPLLLGAFPLGPRQQQLWSVSIFFPIYLNCALSIPKLCSSKGNSGALFCGSIRYKMKIIFCFKIDSLWFFRHFGSLMPVLSMENVLCISFIGDKICMWCSAPTYSATDFTGSFNSSRQVLRDMRWRAPGDGRFLLVAFRGFYCIL